MGLLHGFMYSGVRAGYINCIVGKLLANISSSYGKFLSFVVVYFVVHDKNGSLPTTEAKAYLHMHKKGIQGVMCVSISYNIPVTLN